MIIHQSLKTVGFLVLWLMTTAMAASAQTNVALVVGNSAYQSAKPLSTTIADATAVAETLRGAGYDVTMLKDVRQANLGQAMRDFLDKAAGQGGKAVALFYYAGYAAQSGSDNYVVPVDADIKDARDVPTQALRLGDLIEALAQTPAAARIVVLDASYDHGFGRGTGWVVPPGLAPIEAPPGMMITSAAAPRAVAVEGTGANSLFTETLVNSMRQPGLDFDRVLTATRYQVSQATAGRQTPATASSLTVNVTLFPVSTAAPKPQPKAVEQPRPKKKQAQAERPHRKRVERSASPEPRRGSGPSSPPITFGIGGGGIGIGIGVGH